MIRNEHGTILLVLSTKEAQLIVDGLDEIIFGERFGGKPYDYRNVSEAVYLANYIEERLNKVINHETK